MNPLNLLQLKPAFLRFLAGHPKFPKFLEAAARRDFLDEGSIIEIKAVNSRGQSIVTNLRLSESDLDLIRSLGELSKSP